MARNPYLDEPNARVKNYCKLQTISLAMCLLSNSKAAQLAGSNISKICRAAYDTIKLIAKVGGSHLRLRIMPSSRKSYVPLNRDQG
jgi:hypothetical protein